jgi:hypothetical protein
MTVKDFRGPASVTIILTRARRNDKRGDKGMILLVTWP